jgi:hypothetical protein
MRLRMANAPAALANALGNRFWGKSSAICGTRADPAGPPAEASPEAAKKFAGQLLIGQRQAGLSIERCGDERVMGGCQTRAAGQWAGQRRRPACNKRVPHSLPAAAFALARTAGAATGRRRRARQLRRQSIGAVAIRRAMSIARLRLAPTILRNAARAPLL